MMNISATHPLPDFIQSPFENVQPSDTQQALDRSEPSSHVYEGIGAPEDERLARRWSMGTLDQHKMSRLQDVHTGGPNC